MTDDNDAPDLARDILQGTRGQVLAHPMLTSAQADDALGAPGAAFTAAFAGTLISLDENGTMRVPAFQLDLARGRVRPVVAEVNALLRAGDDPWGCASWWFTPSGALPGGMAPADAAEAGGHEDLLRRLARKIRAAFEPTVLPLLGLTLDEARERLTSLHFAREALSDPEREILRIAEGLLRLIDQRLAGGGTAR